MAIDKSGVLSTVTRVNNSVKEVPPTLNAKLKNQINSMTDPVISQIGHIQQHNLIIMEPIEQNGQKVLLIILLKEIKDVTA